MEKFTTLTAVAAPLNRANVDTDLIIPKQFLATLKRTGLGAGLFHNLRYLEDGRPNPEFVLNQPPYRGTGILVARENFGCGSSREHAPWALMDYGIRAVISPEFADIFKNNSFRNGLLPIELPAEIVDDLLGRLEARPGRELTINLEAQCVSGPDGFQARFEIEPFRKEMLLGGLDEIGLTLKRAPEISAYERDNTSPWTAGRPG